MICERKILFVSDQLSLLTVFAEILCSLLFPVKWSHLYIPLLPRSLGAMLDAPMPFLFGISRENFQYAVGDIGDDVIVVDLDRNVIAKHTKYPNTGRNPTMSTWNRNGIQKIPNTIQIQQPLASAHSNTSKAIIAAIN
jgi:hypothetical protein